MDRYLINRNTAMPACAGIAVLARANIYIYRDYIGNC